MSSTNQREIIKTTLVSGSARVVSIVASTLRSKIVAIYSGPEGVGLLGILTTGLGFLVSLLTCGLDTAASRAIAASAREERIARIACSLKKILWISGLIGLVSCLLLSKKVGSYLFENSEKALAMSMVSIAVLLTTLSVAYITILRGMARVGEMAKQGIAASILSLTSSFLILNFFTGDIAIAAVMAASSALGCLTAWWYLGSLVPDCEKANLTETLRLSSPLLKSGFIYMISSSVSAGGTLAVSVLIKNQGGLYDNGIYQAAWTVTISLTGLMISGMGNDFYPKLTRLVSSGADPSQLISKQTEIGMLLSLPALLFLSVFADQVTSWLYSNEFLGSAAIIPVLAIGCFGRVISWPMAFLLMAKGRARTFMVTEIITVLAHILMVAYAMPAWGTMGVAISFAVLYLAYGFGMSWLVEKLGHVSPIRDLLWISFVGYLLLLLATFLPRSIGISLLIAGIIFSLRKLGWLPGFLR